MAAPTASPDLNELRGFCVAADLGSLGRAAVRLRVSQPSLSKRLASLETKVGARLLERSARGVTLTGAGRRLYRHARPLLEAADQVAEVMVGIRQTGAVVRLAASHSASEAFVAALLTDLNARQQLAVELVTANSQVVRALVADGRADVGVAASRPNHTPNPGVRETELVDDAIVCAVPPGHPWAARGMVSRKRFLATPMVVRDPSSNARWTVDAVLAAADLHATPPLVEAATPRAAVAEARSRRAPVLLSRHVIAQTDLTTVAVDGLSFPRSYVLVTPAYGETTSEVRELVERIREHIRIWLR
jgi:DNA-binding transcriptional LysR family regulator